MLRIDVEIVYEGAPARSEHGSVWILGRANGGKAHDLAIDLGDEQARVGGVDEAGKALTLLGRIVEGLENVGANPHVQVVQSAKHPTH